MMLVALFLALLLAYGLVSERLDRTPLTAPMCFTGAGILAFVCSSGRLHHESDPEAYLRIAELGLVLLLFTDASRTDLRVLKRARDLPARLLGPGLLLTLLLGIGTARLLLPSLSIWEAGILAAILAPTDAGLGQVIVSDARVPQRIRQALNVEAGLNDGLSVPFLLFFIALASTAAKGAGPRLGTLVLEQLGYGTLVGLGVGLGGGWLLALAHRRGWMAGAFRPLAVLSLPLLCLPLSEEVGASMFIAAFVAGLAVQTRFRDAARHGLELTEELGQVLNLSIFFVFGLVVARDGGDIRLEHGLYALASLTVVRMLPVRVALLGAGLARSTVAFLGWFGPRGLASIVLCLVYVSHAAALPEQGTIRSAVLGTVLLSIFAHGLSARPGIRAYARRLASLRPDAPELGDSGSAPTPVDPAAPAHGAPGPS